MMIIVSPQAAATRKLLAEAQMTGDDAYEYTRKSGGTPEARADAYHAAFTAHARKIGYPAACHCRLCVKA
jgi:hypothetical protein